MRMLQPHLPSVQYQVTFDVCLTALQCASTVKKTRLSRVFEYLAAFNRHRCEALSQMPQKEGCPSTTMQIAKCPPEATGGKIPSNLMGDDAVAFLRDFNPIDYEPLHFADCDDSVFMMCLQGANVAKAVTLRLQALRWPPDLDEDDASDCGRLLV